jgi:hypothetical protein
MVFFVLYISKKETNLWKEEIESILLINWYYINHEPKSVSFYRKVPK